MPQVDLINPGGLNKGSTALYKVLPSPERVRSTFPS